MPLITTIAFTMLLLTTSACRESSNGPTVIDGGQTDTSLADATPDSTVDACGNTCTGTTPVCDTATMQCVGCLQSTDCSGTTPICDTTDNTCVQCTTATEATDCAGNSCNPTTRECTSTPLASVGTCGACVSDSDCDQSGSPLRCVETSFNSTTHGTYCLVEASGSCAAPYDNGLPATSVGGTASTYCFPPPLTTCEAVLDFGEDCSTDANCGVQGLNDGLCRTTGLEDNCTYPCSKNDHCDGASCSMATTRYCCTGGAGAGCP